MKKRISILAMALLLLVGALATFAWLTDGTDEIINTFTFANITIELDEEYEPNSVLYPGAEIDKKPTVTVKADSADSYVYVEIVNGLDPGAEIDINTAIWVPVQGNIYRYVDIVEQDAIDDQDLPELFTTVTVDTELSNQEIEDLAEFTITVRAFAIQADVITLEEANAAAVTHFAP